MSESMRLIDDTCQPMNGAALELPATAWARTITARDALPIHALGD